jgi:hypothetical protein
MPASGTITNAATTTMDAVCPYVQVEGIDIPNLYCTLAEQTTGATLGRALLRYAGTGDYTGPITLGLAPAAKWGSRVKVYLGEQVFFLGNLMKRYDQGKMDTVIWEAVDDRIFLEHLFVRGAFVCDQTGDTTYTAKHIRRYVAQFNPGGMWNCTYCPVTTPTGAVENFPMFTPYAHRGTNYTTPDDDYSGARDPGVTVPWTARRALQYLAFVANVGTGFSANVEGVINSQWRSLYGSSRVKWDWHLLSGLVGYDPNEFVSGQTNDPLDRKLPDMTLQGMRLLGAIDQVLRSAGTHELRLEYLTSGMSSVVFYPTGFSGAATNNPDSGQGGEIPLHRSGAVDDINTAFDFELMDDATQCCESVLVEGAPVRIESTLKYDPDDEANSQIFPAWSAAEEQAWRWVVCGGQTESLTNKWAKIPPYQGYTTYSGWVDADGSAFSGSSVLTPAAGSHSPEAVNLAREYFPRVFRAFRIKPSKMATKLGGYDGRYSNTSMYPQIQGHDAYNRPMLPHQLQFTIAYANLTDAECNWLSDRCPIRVEVKLRPEDGGSTSDTLWHDVQYTNGIRATSDGLLWLDSATEWTQPTFGGLLSGDIQAYPLVARVNAIRLNIAYPADHRVAYYTETPNSLFATEYTASMSGKTLLYVDSPEGYHENHQINSAPMAISGYYTNASPETFTNGLTRLVPPGSEVHHAEYAAIRRLTASRLPMRMTSWKMIGIRNEWHAGDWINKIKVRGASDDPDVLINGPIRSVTFDFLAQETRLGGIIYTGLV